MKPSVNFFAGATVGFAIVTFILAVVQPDGLARAFALATAVGAAMTASLWYVDNRVRTMLFDLAVDLRDIAEVKEDSVVYREAQRICSELKHSSSLNSISSELRILFDRLEANTKLEDA